MKLSIIVFRHGSLHSNKNILGGWMNLPLSQKGEKQAMELGKKLKKEKIGVAFCSDLFQSKQALIEVLANHPRTKIIIDSRLRERNFGDLATSLKSIFGKNPKRNQKNFKDYYFAEVNGKKNLHEASKRVFPFLNDLLRFMKKEKCNVIISAHPDSMKLICEFLGGLNYLEAAKLIHHPAEYKKYVVEFG